MTTTQHNEPVSMELPPLPNPIDSVLVGWRNQTEMLTPHDDYYTADQMRDYARSALLSAKPAPARERGELIATLNRIVGEYFTREVNPYGSPPFDMYVTDDGKAIQQAISLLEASVQRQETAKQRYDSLMEGENEPSALKRLRAFCSLAMNDQDWLDVEPLFSDVEEQLHDWYSTLQRVSKSDHTLPTANIDGLDVVLLADVLAGADTITQIKEVLK